MSYFLPSPNFSHALFSSLLPFGVLPSLLSSPLFICPILAFLYSPVPYFRKIFPHSLPFPSVKIHNIFKFTIVVKYILFIVLHYMDLLLPLPSSIPPPLFSQPIQYIFASHLGKNADSSLFFFSQHPLTRNCTNLRRVPKRRASKKNAN